MKNFLLIINIVLLILVGYLYYLHFSDSRSTQISQKLPYSGNSIQNEKAKVAYIDLDSLQNNYGYYKKLKKDFEQKQTQANDEITALQKKYQTRAMQLQQKAATMSPAEQQDAMQEINKMQQDLQEKKTEY